VLSGSWVYLLREVHEAGRNPKLDDQVNGHYQVIETDGRVFKLRIGDDDVPVSSDRITPAPVSDPEPRNREDPTDETARPVAAEDDDDQEEGYEGAPTDEFVLERITGMKKLNDGTLRYKVRWYGYVPEDDTLGTQCSPTRRIPTPLPSQDRVDFFEVTGFYSEPEAARSLHPL
jgi:hypothetical protein